MRIALSLALLLSASAFGALDSNRLYWDDPNPAAVKVIRYFVYDESDPVTPLITVDQPKTTDGTVTVMTPISPDLAGRTIYVTAVNDLGLEALPSDRITLSAVTLSPTALRLAFDFVSRTITLTWSDPNPEVFEYVVYQDGVVVARTAEREAVLPLPDSGRPTYTVAAVGFWNEALSAPIQVPALTVPVAVTNLRVAKD